MRTNGCQGKETIHKESNHTFLLCFGGITLTLLYAATFHASQGRWVLTLIQTTLLMKESIFGDEARAVFINQLRHILL